MSLFKNKKPVIENTFLNVPNENENEAAVNYNSVLDYMLTLTDDDYEKLLKVGKVYRDANKKAAEIIGAEDVAVETMGEPLKSETVDLVAQGVKPGTNQISLDDDDDEALDSFLNEDLAAGFIEDEPKATKKANRKNVGRN